jgi:DNA-binding transcriptional regulator YiaG
MPNLSTLMDDLAVQIREARRAASLSQKELALRLGCSVRSLQDWEAGVALPQPRYRRALAAFINGAEEPHDRDGN